MSVQGIPWYGDESDPTPPAYQVIQGNEAAKVRACLARAVGLLSDANGLAVLSALAGNASVVGREAADPESLDLERLISKCGVERPDEVYLAWDPLKTLYRMRFQDLRANLPLLFQPGALDLLVLPVTLEWALTLFHYGDVSIVRLPLGLS
jgi:hypothetical protein